MEWRLKYQAQHLWEYEAINPVKSLRFRKCDRMRNLGTKFGFQTTLQMFDDVQDCGLRGPDEMSYFIVIRFKPYLKTFSSRNRSVVGKNKRSLFKE
ncbi:hypothetical protein AVEN_214488-1 [Araneus ventricosus]|uniref:Uncharacterized protein n=1 Tax=Araneus ventricosus TaxID=182803 RepID=A0A4Y2CUL6_ARAVE|nr:hypothetical protein AVEN_214488-1 [Araneus ventricosus]